MTSLLIAGRDRRNVFAIKRRNVVANTPHSWGYRFGYAAIIL